MKCDYRHKKVCVLGGGGVYGYCMLGAIQFLLENKMNVNCYVGTSIGSIIGMLLCCGYTIQEITTSFSNRKVHKSIITSNISLKNVFENFGSLSIETIFPIVDKMIESKVGMNATYEDLWNKTGKELTVVCTNVTERKSEYFSRKTTPHMHVSLSLRMSCCIPILFQPIKYNDSIYVDGALCDNFAIDFTRNILQYTNAEIIGVRVATCTHASAITNLFDYLLAISGIVRDTVCNRSVQQYHSTQNTMTIDTSALSIDMYKILTDKTIPYSQFQSLTNYLYSDGFRQTQKTHLSNIMDNCNNGNASSRYDP